MATSFQFDNQNVIIPGVKSNIKSGIVNPPANLPFGNLLIIDTGSGASWGGGAGVDGELAKGKDAIYEFDNILDFQNFAKGDLWWLLANPLFRPAGFGVPGVSKISYIKAATTVAATMTFAPEGDSYDGGSLTIKVTDEGLIGNGTLASGNLSKGYAFKMAAGTVDTTKFTLNFYLGTYKGLDQNGLSFDSITAETAVPTLVAKSPEFNNISTLIEWMNSDFTFSKYFKLSSSTTTGSGEITTADLTTYTAYTLASGGTESYASSTLLTSALDAVSDLNINFVLCDKYGSNSQHANNTSIVSFFVASDYKPQIYIACGTTVSNFTQSKADAVAFNTQYVTPVHGGIKKITQTGIKLYDSIYKAAAFVGRECGLEPQVPTTFKNIDIDGEQHLLNDKEVKQALAVGLMVSRLSNGTFDIVKGVNSLQKNTYLINADGTTHSKQLLRIATQMNNEIRINAHQDLLKQPNGVNRNTLSERDVEAWLIGYLTSRKALPGRDNLILSFQDIVVTRNQDAYYINYKFVPNTEISFLFFTGLVIGI